MKWPTIGLQPPNQSGPLPNKIILFVAETSKSESITEQIKRCGGDADIIIEGGKVGIMKLAERLAKEGRPLQAGDRLRIYDLSCISINTTSFIRLVGDFLRDGIAVEFAAPTIVIEPDDTNDLFRLVHALDSHWRQVHGMKTHPSDAKTGRKALLSEDQLPDIKERLALPGATVGKVAKGLGVGRTTLFDFLQRHRAAEPAS